VPFRACFFEPSFFKFNFTVVGGVQYFPHDPSAPPAQQPSASSLSPQSAEGPRAAPRQGGDGIDGIASFTVGAHVLATWHRLFGPQNPGGKNFTFAWDGSWFGHPGEQLIDWYAGTPRLRELVDQGMDALSITAAFDEDVKAWRATRKAFFSYE
jgi:hypothetical protein